MCNESAIMVKNNKLLLVLYLSIFSFSAFSQQSVFFNYSLEDGIPQSTVLCLYQDINRNMWIGTQGGICKYNGQNFEAFDTRHGLTDNHISSIFQDSNGRFWFGHRYEGVTMMQGKEFRKIKFTNSRINTIKEDLQGNIWFGTLDSALFVLPKGKDECAENFKAIKISEYPEIASVYDLMVVDSSEIWIVAKKGLWILKYNLKDSFSFELTKFESEFLSRSGYYSILKATDGNYWLLGDIGLVKFSLVNDSSIKINKYPFDRTVSLDYLLNISLDKDGVIWGATNQGIFKFENSNYEFYAENEGLPDLQINAIVHDVEGNVWIGSTNTGVYKYSGDKFKIYNKESGLNDEVVLTITEDSREHIWVGTNTGVFIVKNGIVHPFRLPKGYIGIEINSIYEDSKGNIWLGSYSDHDLLRYNPVTHTFKKYNKSNGMSTPSVLTICEDKNGCVWFATLGIGLSKYTYPKTGNPEKFESFTQNDGFSSVVIWTIQKDKEGNLWFGRDDKGMIMYDGTEFKTFSTNNGSLNISAGAIAQDSKNQLWIAASSSGGIYKFDGVNLINYSVEHGLTSDNPYSIICDEKDKIWIGTNSGIDKFDPETETFKHYGKEEGFLGIENNQNAVFKSHNGNLWFGTINGLVEFNPEKVRPNLLPPKTSVENIKLFYAEFNYSQYTDSLDKYSKLPLSLNLPFNKNHLTFDFCGVSLSVPGKVEYQYKLENFDLEWNPVTKSTTATYTNIPPGEYVFKVKASNNDGIWNDQPTQIPFTILAPYWQTWWFITSLIILILGFIYLIFYLRLKSIKFQRVKLQRLVNEKTKELVSEIDERKKATLRAEQSDRLKTAFLANMSHEIRTPVNAITGFTELLYDENLSEEERNVYLEYINNGGKALLNLIDDIIDISKIEAGQLLIREEDCAINSLISDLLKMFHKIKQKKGKMDVELKVSGNLRNNDLVIKTDANRLRQIFSNLIQNAIKFTHKGFIEFGYVIENSDQIVFYVKDTGIGIAEDKIDIIFQRFRQVEETFTKNYQGTGLGLAISKKLTNLLGGKMWVESILGKGSTFYFSIPLQIVKNNVKINGENASNDKVNKLEGRNILVVEDEDSNYILTETILKAYKVNVLRAEDGISAVDMIRKNGQYIDLILMDIKIPGINGYEATTEIKKIKSEIPIIAQTAYVLAEEREKCLEAGCDDYIPKPIDRTILLQKINKCLNS